MTQRRSVRETAKAKIDAKRKELAAQLAYALRERMRDLANCSEGGACRANASFSFEESPTSLTVPIMARATVRDRAYTAVIDPAVCRGMGYLAAHTMYTVKYIPNGDKLNILSYRAMSGLGSGEAELQMPSAVQKCSDMLGDAVKLSIHAMGVVRELREEERGAEFILECGSHSYSCRVAADVVPKESAVYLVEGEKHVVTGLLAGDTLHVFSGMCMRGDGYAMEKPAQERAAEKAAEKPVETVTITGKIRFDVMPDVNRDVFRFTLVGSSCAYRVRLARSRTDVAIKDGAMASLECVKSANGVYTVKAVRGSAQKDMQRLPEELRGGACIIMPLRGSPEEIVRTGHGQDFTVEVNGKRYRCKRDDRVSCDSAEALVFGFATYDMEIMLCGKEAYLIKCEDCGEMAPEKSRKLRDMLDGYDRDASRLSGEKQAEVERIRREHDVHPLLEKDKTEAFGESELELKYRVCRRFYPQDVQRAIERVKANGELKNAHKRAMLEILVNTPWSRKLTLNRDAKSLMEQLNKTHYGQEYLKRSIIKIFIAYAAKAERKGEAILAVGAPGVGKTSLFQAAAEAFGLPCAKISLNGVDTPLFLKGTPRLYDNAICGKILRTLRRVGDRSMIILDEVDKMPSTGREGNPYSALYDLLDPNEKFQDNFLEEGIDLSDTVFVLTANDISAVPPAVLDRVSVIHVPDYTCAEKCAIARGYVIPRECGKYDMEGKTIRWTDEAVEDIATRFTLTNGVRDIEKNVAAILRGALDKMAREGISELEIDRKTAAELADVHPFRRDRTAHDISAIKDKFKFFKFSYAPHVRAEIASMLEKYDASHSESDREMLRRAMALLVNLLPEPNKRTFDLARVKAALDESHYGMEEVKERLLIALAGMNAAGGNGTRCLLLDGPCGVGKTSICKTVASAMGRAFVKISLNGIDTAQFIRGFERTWKNSDCGAVVKKLAECGTDAAVVLLDEIDKMNATGERDPYSALLDLVDDSGMFTDTFLGMPLDLRNVIFIATSNNRARIPAALLDRMETIELAGYSEEEKLHITQDYILPAALKKYRVQDITFDAAAVGHIVSCYCKGFGMRDVSAAVDKIICTVLKERECGNYIRRVTAKHVSAALGARPLERGNVAVQARMRPGIARALAVSGNAGSTFAVQVAKKPFGGGDELTGLPGRSTVDSIKIAKHLVSDLLGRDIGAVHVHFAEGGIEKDGPSAGITLFAAIYSCFTGICIDRRVAFTGEIDIFGDVWAIGGAELKLRAAECEGCTRVLIPRANYTQLEEDGALEKYRLEIIPVENVEDICGILFDNAARHSA